MFFPICIGLHTLVLGVFQSWNGGAAPVQRYLVPLAPMLILCIGLLLDRVRSKVVWGVAAALGLWTIVTTVWTFRFMVGTYGIEATDNIFVPHFLDNGFAKKFLFTVFPLLHPAGIGGMFLILAWILFFAVTIYLARRYHMHYGGGKIPPPY